MTTSSQRTPQSSSWLEGVFELPIEFSADPDLSDMYNGMVLEMRTEARGIPMNTIQTLLIERIAYYYTSLRKAEREGQLTAVQMEKLNKFWLDMTSEFNKQLAAGHEKLRHALLMSISDMVMEKLEVVPDPETKKRIILSLKEGFAEMGL